MIPNVKLENGQEALIREILDIKDMQDIDLLKEYKNELNFSLCSNTNKEVTEEV